MVKCFLDLEFNLSDTNASTGRYGMECVSIGACFLDEDNNVIEEFYSLIKPRRNAKLGYYYAKLTHLKQEEIYKADNFIKVMNKFSNTYFKYDDVKIYTWGSEDSRMLFRDINNNSYVGKIKGEFKKIIDLQEIVSNSIRYEDKVIKKQWSLKDMQILYNNPEYIDHHNALTDAIMLKDIYIAYMTNKDLNLSYLNIFIEKIKQEELERLQNYELTKNDYFQPNRIETYINIRNWKSLNQEFLKKYPMIKHKYYNCKKIIVTINKEKLDFFYVINKDDYAHLHLILDSYNFRKIKKYLNSLTKTQKKDVL